MNPFNYVVLILDLVYVALICRFAWRSVPCITVFAVAMGALSGAIIMLLGDLDFVLPDGVYGIGMTTARAPRSLFAQACLITGLLFSELYYYRVKKR